MHVEPLHLIPEELRDDFKAEYGVYIEGELCPVCRYKLARDGTATSQRCRSSGSRSSERDGAASGPSKPADPIVPGRRRADGCVNIRR
jgi:serine protein kinase